MDPLLKVHLPSVTKTKTFSPVKNILSVVSTEKVWSRQAREESFKEMTQFVNNGHV